ncbi:MAG: hypothetical protein ACTS7I_02070 [Candidatus Hodgkinia cicadicola]
MYKSTSQRINRCGYHSIMLTISPAEGNVFASEAEAFHQFKRWNGRRWTKVISIGFASKRLVR